MLWLLKDFAVQICETEQKFSRPAMSLAVSAQEPTPC